MEAVGINSFIRPSRCGRTIAASTRPIQRTQNFECSSLCILCFQFSARPGRRCGCRRRGWSWDCSRSFWSPFVNRTAFNYARFGAVYINRRACKKVQAALCRAMVVLRRRACRVTPFSGPRWERKEERIAAEDRRKTRRNELLGSCSMLDKSVGSSWKNEGAARKAKQRGGNGQGKLAGESRRTGYSCIAAS